MPRLTIQCPKYRRHKARNLAFVVLSGQKTYLGQWQSAQSLQLYDKLLSLWLQNGRQLTGELLHQSGTASKELEATPPLTVQRLADQYNEQWGSKGPDPFACVIQQCPTQAISLTTARRTCPPEGKFPPRKNAGVSDSPSGQ